MPGIPLEHTSVYLSNVHPTTVCEGHRCPLHNRSDHPMRDFPQQWRPDRRILERICPHGVAHPDPDLNFPSTSHEWIHGCDGCCHPLLNVPTETPEEAEAIAESINRHPSTRRFPTGYLAANFEIATYIRSAVAEERQPTLADLTRIVTESDYRHHITP